MKPADMTNIHVDCYDGRRCSAGFEIGTDRYHVWLDLPALTIQNDIVFKNPIAKRGEPGYYEHTRRLDVTNATNKAAIEHLLDVVKRDGLVEKAIQTEKDAQAAKVAKARAEVEGKILEIARLIREHVGTAVSPASVESAARAIYKRWSTGM
jgi:hypothetical protein